MPRVRSNVNTVDLNDDMANAREGVIYLWANMNKVSPLTTIASFMNINKLGLAGVGSGGYLSYHYIKDGGMGKSEAGKLMEWCTGAVNSIMQKLSFGSDGDGVGGMIAKILFTNMSPFIFDIAGGVWGLYTFGKTLVNKIELWWKGWKVKLVKGHSQTIVKAVGQLINNEMLEGLFAVVKAAISASLKFISMGTSVVANAIAGVIESIIRLIYMFKQRKYINNFIEDCKQYWRLPEPARISALSGTADHFNDMFLEATENAPVIGGITYATNICGDKMRFLQLITADGSVLSQKKFNNGVSYLDAIKKHGRVYSNGWAKNLSSDDLVIKGLLRIVRKGENALISKKPWYKFWGNKETTMKYSYNGGN
ncbi:hypothetical protein HR060_02100 [Catenovulum sp. SM1970]|uniref:hypothetical protein n=1 Tax=Marinifaba aquimaris TaxID=2741323 RepID=UPI001572F599|nr:hypothetical protein [Marinifaba aquimaris]NTS75647.1 hypothetical protein [Marinifaba aquimaris]